VPGTYGDGTLSVDAQLMQPRDDQYVELACRERDPSTEYRFGFRPTTGEVGISRWYRLTGAPPFTQLVDTFTSAIPDGSSFRISLGCVGTRLTASINGTNVITVSDNTLASGQFWIGVGETSGGTQSDVLADAHFKNIAVTPGP
jgi:hypothetical protein